MKNNCSNRKWSIYSWKIFEDSSYFAITMSPFKHRPFSDYILSSNLSEIGQGLLLECHKSARTPKKIRSFHTSRSNPSIKIICSIKIGTKMRNKDSIGRILRTSLHKNTKFTSERSWAQVIWHQKSILMQIDKVQFKAISKGLLIPGETRKDCPADTRKALSMSNDSVINYYYWIYLISIFENNVEPKE